MNHPGLKERYMSFSLPVRLGNLASSLAHLSTTAEMKSQHDHVPRMLRECKSFIEWTGPETEVEIAEQLVGLQVQLAIWQLSWDSMRRDPIGTEQLVTSARASSDQVLQWSGLLDE
jgi:hypothetical protein